MIRFVERENEKIQGLLQSLLQSFETLSWLIENAPAGETRRSMIKAQGYLSATVDHMKELLKEEEEEEAIEEFTKFSRFRT
jgi:hypothetical protein